jgi:hypothetical protein
LILGLSMNKLKTILLTKKIFRKNYL